MVMKGSYTLLINLPEHERIRVGGLGTVDFSSGCYAYVGSAMGGFKSRLSRYLRNDKKPHWHIDYLLNNEEVELTSIYTIESGEQLECRIAKRVARHGTPVPRFGCSDCKCASHLFKVDDLDFITEIGLKKWA